jgi:hypothetical protein
MKKGKAMWETNDRRSLLTKLLSRSALAAMGLSAGITASFPATAAISDSSRAVKTDVAQRLRDIRQAVASLPIDEVIGQIADPHAQQLAQVWFSSVYQPWANWTNLWVAAPPWGSQWYSY